MWEDGRAPDSEEGIGMTEVQRSQREGGLLGRSIPLSSKRDDTHGSPPSMNKRKLCRPRDRSLGYP